MKIFFAILLLCIFSACHTKVEKPKVSERDSLVYLYNGILRSSAYSDTSEINYQVLKSYVKNDTNSLKKLLREVRYSHSYIPTKWLKEDSILHNGVPSNSAHDETYKYFYVDSWCPYRINITVQNL
ncbi:MAG: hypothetical protein RI955_728, partial [Bacteroidota bacterium]